ncbi:MAG: DUF4935 domain-containing protein [Paludibacter sp.]|nr:DUF4935 domain-containing protein [Paludibacter sp.]
MSKITSCTISSIENFVVDIYSPNKKHIIFWDTCSLLEIIRFLYRGGNVNSYKNLNSINKLIQRDEIYSIASTLTIKEWNDNEAIVIDRFKNDLKLTSKYHKDSIETINEINTTAYDSESIFDKNLTEDLISLAESIILKTIFIETNDIANKALDRVSYRRPPANKKNEFKDCAVWETMYLVCDKINQTKLQTDNYNFVFYTVNTDDFIDKSREPKIFHGSLLSEASVVNMICCQKTEEVFACF